MVREDREGGVKQKRSVKIITVNCHNLYTVAMFVFLVV
jgi:hypothetical protein